MRHLLSCVLLSASLFITVSCHSQIKEKIDNLQQSCRLVRVHAHMIEQMIIDDGFNEYVARGHFEIIERGMKEMEMSLREVELSVPPQQTNRIKPEIEKAHQICNEIKPVVSSLRQTIDSEEINLQTVRILSGRIVRNLKEAGNVLLRMSDKLE